jgi:dipeptidyl aminopeptidase/acylaminoacyl peptidase
VQRIRLVLSLCSAVPLFQVCTCEALSQSIQGAQFDRTPVRLPRSALAVKRPVDSSDLLRLRDVKGMSISPDGKWIAFVVGQAMYEANAYRSALFVVSTVDSRLRSFGTAGTPHWNEINQWEPEDPQWSADSKVVWYRGRLKESDHWQVWSWNLASGKRLRATRFAGDVENYRLVSQGRVLFITVAKRASPDRRSKAYQPGLLFPGPIRPYQSISVTTQLRWAQEPKREYWVHNLRSRHERRATTEEIDTWKPRDAPGGESLPENARKALEKYHLSEAKDSPDGTSVAYTYVVDDPSTSRSWGRRLLLLSKGTGQAKELTPDAHFVDEFWWRPDGAELYFTKREGVGRSHELWKASADGSVIEPVFKPAGTDYFSSFSSDARGRRFACLVENNTTPPRVALFESGTRNARTLVDLNEDFNALDRSPAERIEGTNRYGDTWYGYLVKPLGYKPGTRYPLVVTTYRSGDFFLRGASGDQNPVQVYAAEGFAVFCFDVGMIRNVHPGHFEEKLLDWASPTASLEAAIRELDTGGLIDAARVGIAGYSHGEEIAGYAITHTDLFHAAVGAAMYEPYFYFMGGAEWWDLFETWGLGGWPYGKSADHWKRISMAQNAERIHTPVLHTVSDTEYLLYLPLYRSFVDMGKPVELYVYPDELHVRNQPRHRFEIYELNLDWFAFWLKREERTGKEKKEQYARWRKMREHVPGLPDAALAPLEKRSCP